MLPCFNNMSLSPFIFGTYVSLRYANMAKGTDYYQVNFIREVKFEGSDRNIVPAYE